MGNDLHEESLANGKTLRLYKNALSISTDALLLSGFLPTEKEKEGLEIGTGGGTVSVLCALREKLSHIDAVEIQGELCDLARENLEKNGLTERVTLIEGDARTLYPTKRYPIIFSNPPYYKVGGGKIPQSRLSYLSRFEENLTLSELLETVERLLSDDGRFFAVYPYSRKQELLEEAEKRSLFPSRLFPVAKHEGAAPSLFLIELGKKGSNLYEESPLLLYTDQTHTAESPLMLRLYEKGILFPEKENL